MTLCAKNAMRPLENVHLRYIPVVHIHDKIKEFLVKLNLNSAKETPCPW